MFPEVDGMFPEVDGMFPEVDGMFPEVDEVYPQGFIGSTAQFDRRVEKETLKGGLWCFSP